MDRRNFDWPATVPESFFGEGSPFDGDEGLWKQIAYDLLRDNEAFRHALKYISTEPLTEDERAFALTLTPSLNRLDAGEGGE